MPVTRIESCRERSPCEVAALRQAVRKSSIKCSRLAVTMVPVHALRTASVLPATTASEPVTSALEVG